MMARPMPRPRFRADDRVDPRWLNADDVLKPGAVSAAVEALRAHPGAGLVYGHADFIAADGHIIGPCTVVEPYSRQRLLHYGDYIIQPAAFFTRRAYTEAGGLDRSLHWAMDWTCGCAWPGITMSSISTGNCQLPLLGSNKTAAEGSTG